MKRFCITILSTIFLLASLSAQNLSVSSFRPLETDLTANTHGTLETDQNGETVALIKVVTTQTDFTFEWGYAGYSENCTEKGRDNRRQTPGTGQTKKRQLRKT